VIHSARLPFVTSNPKGCLGDSSPGIDLVNQAEPFASFHPLFEGRQHAVCPDPRFGARPMGREHRLSTLFSIAMHCRWLFFRCLVHSVIHLPASLRSTGVTPLLRYYGSSDSCRVAFLGRVCRCFVPLRPRHRGGGPANRQAAAACCLILVRVRLPNVPAGLPSSRLQASRAFRLQPPSVVPSSVCFPLGRTAFCLGIPVCRGCGIWGFATT